MFVRIPAPVIGHAEQSAASRREARAFRDAVLCSACHGAGIRTMFRIPKGVSDEVSVGDVSGVRNGVSVGDASGVNDGVSVGCIGVSAGASVGGVDGMG